MDPLKPLDNGGPAFARPQSRDPETYQYPESYPAQEGMSLRAWLAGRALGGMELKNDGRYSKDDRDRGLPEKDAMWAATAACRYADAVIAALARAEGVA